MPFRQIDTTRTRDYGGLGLGLAIVQRLAGLHGGVLTATSAGPGRGSCFTVRLPLAPQLASAAGVGDGYQGEEHGGEEPLASEISASAPQPLTVLVVEDGQDAADLLCDLLESEGFAVRLARDGISALQLAAADMPAVCIMDIGLPGMDGYELARRIRRMDPHRRVRLVALTGWGSEADRRLSHEAGFDVHLVKPIVYSELLHHVTAPHAESRQQLATISAVS